MVKGISFSGIHTGLKTSPHKDLGVIYSKKGLTVSGMLTQNKFRATCIDYAEDLLASKRRVHAIFVNSGNANALTGDQGQEANIRFLLEAESKFGLPKKSSLLLSTGIIAKQLPSEVLTSGLSSLKETLTDDPKPFSEAILTTDLTTKTVSKELTINGTTVMIEGIAKGSGMIMPNMATMLAFIVTDATVSKPLLDQIIKEAVDHSFNCISVDGDTSTNDAFLIASSNEGPNIEKDDIKSFRMAIKDISIELAKAIVKDGEGATKFVEIIIKNAKDYSEAKNIFQAVANSPLVKTALFGENPNFGRILAAAGKIKSSLIPEKTDLFLGDHEVITQGGVNQIDRTVLDSYMKEKNISITLNLNNGQSGFVGWTTDLSHDYIDINAEYN